MIISMLNKGCRVGFFGLGVSNVALMSSLPLEKCQITLRSDSEISQSRLCGLPSVHRVFSGKNCCLEIDEDIIFFSPSVRRDRPELVSAKEKGVFFSSDAELFFELNKRPVFLVSGSDGKSTTATLVHLLLSSAGYKSRLIGNIGDPMTKNLLCEADYYVIELSSFMLSYLKPKAEAACITNITPNHLDWHKSFLEYKETKLSIFENAKRAVVPYECDGISPAFAVISADTDFETLKKTRQAELYFTSENGYICKNGEKIIPISYIKRNEIHNLKNLMMAIAITDGLVEKTHILSVAESFSGLSHRCESVFSEGGVEYIDSSIDSTPARTAQTLESLGKPVVLILGGRSKGVDYKELTHAVKKYARTVIITGENSKEIFEEIKAVTKAEIIEDFTEAVLLGKRYAKEVGTLLLSPASTSYDRFENYAVRGDRFKEILLKAKKNKNKSLQNTEEMRKNGETDLS